MKTILLVPEVGDPHGLLADEVGGGRVPTMRYDRLAGAPSRPCPVCSAPTRWRHLLTDQMDGQYICTSNVTHRFLQEYVTPMGWLPGRSPGCALGLLLAYEGVPVPMGCDRMCRWANEQAGTAPMLRYSMLEVADIGHRVAKLTGARLVFLDDGVEVGE